VASIANYLSFATVASATGGIRINHLYCLLSFKLFNCRRNFIFRKVKFTPLIINDKVFRSFTKVFKTLMVSYSIQNAFRKSVSLTNVGTEF